LFLRERKKRKREGYTGISKVTIILYFFCGGTRV
jgi:hypothetical protein